MSRLFPPARSAGMVLLAASLCAITGCGASKADVTGTVTYRGKPLVWGTVIVIGSDHMPYYGFIQADGTFNVKNVPLGPAQLGVGSLNPYYEPKFEKPEHKARYEELQARVGLEMPPKPPKGAWFPIPAKYNDPLKSGLTADVKSPATTVDLKLD
jgi:hypothetical protein